MRFVRFYALVMVALLAGCPKMGTQTGSPENNATPENGAVNVQSDRAGDSDRYILYVDNLKDRAFVQKAQGEVFQGGARILKTLSEGRGFVAQGNASLLQRIADRQGLRLEKDQILRLVVPLAGREQPLRQQVVPSGITQIKANQSTSKGAGVKVCIVDTGINLSHPDLKANILDSFNTISSASAEDDNGHGTHVAGTIAAVDNTVGVIGVAPQAKLIAAKALSASGSGYSSDLAEAIDGCRTRKAQVISASWGSASASSVIQSAVQRALAENIFFVAAAGNESLAKVSFPANIPGAIAVSAVDSQDLFASFSNYGVEVAHAAPGVNTLSTYLGGRYKMLSGTSMATPHVSGAVALLLAVNPKAKPEDLDGIDIGLPATKQGKRGRVDVSGY